MTEFHNGKTVKSRGRPNSLCSRCGNVRRNSRDDPGRGSWADRSRSLSLEVDGREGRRRHSSEESKIGKKGASPIHCYIVPKANGPGSLPITTSTTYRESFRLPSANHGFSRRVASAPSSPLSGSSMSSQESVRSPQPFANSLTVDGGALASRLGTRSGNYGRRNSTTYTDHFTWMS